MKKGQPVDVDVSGIRAWLCKNDPTRGLIETEAIVNKESVGVYVIESVANFEGQHYLKIHRDKKSLFGDSKVGVLVEKETQKVSQSLDFAMEGRALSSAKINEPVVLDFEIKEDNKRVDVNLAELFLQVTGNGKKFQPLVSRTGVGTYTASFAADLAGYYRATLIYQENKVISQKIVLNEKSNARCSKIEEFQTTVSAGKPGGFSIISYDMHGNRIGTGGDPWSVVIHPVNVVKATEPKVKINDLHNGKYVVEFTLPECGTYNIKVCIDENHAKGSPFTIKAQ